ncbi:hypothetical protein FRB93_004007 [Tulasnella sp. JGI-2019a]|nr:hypothetical protein FRB93_004007 [Tulasnella sp. JGI-2019a]
MFRVATDTLGAVRSVIGWTTYVVISSRFPFKTRRESPTFGTMSCTPSLGILKIIRPHISHAPSLQAGQGDLKRQHFSEFWSSTTRTRQFPCRIRSAQLVG